MTSKRTFILLTFLVMLSAQAADLYVAPTGKDSNPGTRAAPFDQLATARDAARQFVGKEAVTIHVADGVYYLPETLIFTPAGLASDQIFIESKRQRTARYPNFNPEKVTAVYQGFSSDVFSTEPATKWANPVVEAARGKRRKSALSGILLIF